MVISRSIHVAANDMISFFFMAEWYSIVYMWHIFFIHSSVNGRLGCLLLKPVLHSPSDCVGVGFWELWYWPQIRSSHIWLPAHWFWHFLDSYFHLERFVFLCNKRSFGMIIWKLSSCLLWSSFIQTCFFEHLLCAGSSPLYQECLVNLMNEVPAHKELTFPWRERINELSRHKSIISYEK